MQQTLDTPQDTTIVARPAGNGHSNGDTPSQANGRGDNGGVSFADLLDSYEYPAPTKGEILEGTIIRIKPDMILVDVGAKRDAVVPYEEVSEFSEEYLKSLKPGDTLPVYVTRTPRGDEDLLVSLERGLEEEDWERADELLDSGEINQLPITGYNKGGLQVQFGRISGFVPNSRELELRQIRDRQQRTVRKREMIGQTLPLQIIEIDRRRRRLVLSAIEAQQDRRKSELEELEEDSTVTGIVASLTDFGAFVDIGNLTGLLHISKIGWTQLDHPADVLQVGEEVAVRIDSVDVEKGRISLNRRALLPGPWDEFLEAYEEDDLIEGTATSLTTFGVFVEVRPGLEGLLHKSEMPLDGQEPSDVITKGDRLLLRIVSIDRDRERLGLSMNRVSAQEEVAYMMAQSAGPAD